MAVLSLSPVTILPRDATNVLAADCLLTATLLQALKVTEQMATNTMPMKGFTEYKGLIVCFALSPVLKVLRLNIMGESS